MLSSSSEASNEVADFHAGSIDAPSNTEGRKTSISMASAVLRYSIDSPTNSQAQYHDINRPITKSLRALCMSGNTYTLTPHVEDILRYVSIIGSHINRFKYASQQGFDDLGNFDQEASIRNPRVHLDDAIMELQNLTATLNDILAPLSYSVNELTMRTSNLCSISDQEFWGLGYDDKLIRALKWDHVARMTVPLQLLPQYLPVYHSIRRLLLAELPTPKVIAILILDPDQHDFLINTLFCVQHKAFLIQKAADDAFALTQGLIGPLQNCLATLQYCVQLTLEPIFQEEANATSESLFRDTSWTTTGRNTSFWLTSQNAPPFETPDDSRSCTLIFDTLSKTAATLRRMRLPDDTQIEALPTSFLNLFVFQNSEDPDVEEGCLPEPRQSALNCSNIVELKRCTAILSKFRPLTAHVNAKWLLPYLLEIASYTRGAVLTQVDRFLAGYVIQKDMMIQTQRAALAACGPDFLSTSRPATISRESSSSRKRSDSNMCVKTDSLQSSASHGTLNRRGFIEKLNLTFTTSSKPEVQIFETASSTSSGSIKARNSTNFERKRDSQSFQDSDAPRQQIWPVSSCAVFASGAINEDADGNLEYAALDPGQKRDDIPDEDFPLEDVFAFYNAAFLEDKVAPIGAYGSSATRNLMLEKNVKPSVSRVPSISRSVAQDLEPVKAEPTSKPGETQMLPRNSLPPSERNKIRFSGLIKRLHRFKQFMNENIRNKEPVTEQVAGERRAETLIKEVWEQRNEYREVLRCLAEVKAEVRCVYDADCVISKLSALPDCGSLPFWLKDREENLV
ncbi:hypothetical protein BDZ91DRAFT_793049 [Kalaharituber pfeilii]|nr:hypothetical protein BDZ91DRAFT_793049 [Kalaharituber pfeilii]